MFETIQVTDSGGIKRNVEVLCRFTQKIHGSTFGFVVHKSTGIRRMVLLHEKSRVRIGVLSEGEIKRVGLTDAGRGTLQRFIESEGEIRTAGILGALPGN